MKKGAETVYPERRADSLLTTLHLRISLALFLDLLFTFLWLVYDATLYALLIGYDLRIELLRTWTRSLGSKSAFEIRIKRITLPWNIFFGK